MVIKSGLNREQENEALYQFIITALNAHRESVIPRSLSSRLTCVWMTKNWRQVHRAPRPKYQYFLLCYLIFKYSLWVISIRAAMAERTKVPLLSRSVFTGLNSGLNPVSTKICFVIPCSLSSRCVWMKKNDAKCTGRPDQSIRIFSYATCFPSIQYELSKAEFIGELNKPADFSGHPGISARWCLFV